MKDAALFKWREFAWNGIRFAAPEKWEAGKIGRRYLLLEEAAKPMLELKWGRIKGKFSHRRQLRRLSALHAGALQTEITECPLPAKWKSALANFNASGFRWEGKTFQGLGAILYCPVCQNAAFIQFYRHNRSETKPIAHQILASFHDHHRGEQAVWSVFDIRAHIPTRLKLTSFRFDAGHFFLQFKSKEQALTLNRWGPASTLLSGRDFLQLAAALNQTPTADDSMRLTVGDREIEGARAPSHKRWFSILNHLKSTPPFERFRLWHLADKNRILGLRMESKKPFDATLFNQLCAGYESL